LFERLKKSFSGVLEKFSKTELKKAKLDRILEDFELSLLASDVALPVAEKISDDLRKSIVGMKFERFKDPIPAIRGIMCKIIINILSAEKTVDILKLAAEKKLAGDQLIIIFFGVNGTGKTTTIAKVAQLLMKNGHSLVLACSDTYRAGSIEQLEEHAKRLGVRIIKHTYGADAAAVAFDAVSHAKANNIDAVLIDTAGRMETNKNLMMELVKIKRVVTPSLSILVIDALIGNDAVLQAEEFDSAVGIDATIVTKVDADAKGGACLSVSYVTGKPIIYLGNGQEYNDLVEFNPEEFTDLIFPDCK
jgi:fused signal recognition particle receptor